MTKRSKRSNKRFTPIGVEIRQLPLPLEWISTVGNQVSVHDTTALVVEVEHTCPICGKKLERKKGCWSCDGCGYYSCGE